MMMTKRGAAWNTNAAKVLTPVERAAAGTAARSKMERGEHAAFDEKACPADPLKILFAAERGRLPDLLSLKHAMMAKSPFIFFRGAAPIMAADLAAQPHSGMLTQLCGDAHMANLGAFADPMGKIVFDINDFDETICGPFEWDLKRFATSILLAGREAKIVKRDRRAAAMAFVKAYQSSMAAYAEMPIHELACHRVHLAHKPPIAGIFKLAEHDTVADSLAKLITVAKGGQRTFKTDLPRLRPLEGAERAAVLASLAAYAETLEPAHRHFFAQYVPLAAAFKVVGTGSVGLRCYCVYFEGSHASTTDPLFLQVKEEARSAYAAYLGRSVAKGNEGARVVDGQRAMQLSSDPFLGYTTITDEAGVTRDYLVRQLNDHKAGLDLTKLTAATLRGYAEVAGELFARGHARAGDPVALRAYLGKSGVFAKAVVEFAHAYADKTERDCGAMSAWVAKQVQTNTDSSAALRNDKGDDV